MPVISGRVAWPSVELALEDLVKNNDHYRGHYKHHAGHDHSRTMKKPDEFSEEIE